ncbi:hypothetical protein DL769_011263 [Monosporascus sp. CRB-8-3]|nr:hypothetical protein DL769_011263 [Monosporascus sp. CRB-8-3]
MAAAAGPPYPPLTASLGGLPAVIPDVVVSAIFIALFLGLAVANMAILQANKRRRHRFPVSGMLFGLCMARVTTLILRITWAAAPRNVRLGLAANIFVNCGVVLLYAANLVFALRVLRARQPPLGWHPALRVLVWATYACIVASVVMAMTSAVWNAYTLPGDVRAKLLCRTLLQAASTMLLVAAALPLLFLALATLLPRRYNEESFGRGSMLAKMLVLALSALLCLAIAGFKAATAWAPARPISAPAWYHSPAPFYLFLFTLELVDLTLLTASRVDQRFYVPDGSWNPGDYSRDRRLSDTSSKREVAAVGRRRDEDKMGSPREPGQDVL